MSNNAHDLSNRLLNALDTNYNVVDMQAVNEIISILEKFNITKELLETTRLGKHVNELRRKTTDPTLARRAKVLVKRWRDLVIPTVASPGHTGSNRSSAERQVRRLGGTPLTSPALSRVVSPAVNSPRPPSRPAWGGYESDSQDVILVDDDPPPPAPAPPAPVSLAPPPPNALHKPLTPPVKRPTSPVAVHDEKKAKRDKKPKKRRGHSRAGTGTEATDAPAPAAPVAPAPVAPAAPAAPAPGAWGARNGSSERRRNGYRREKLDPYAALVNKLPPAGAKKVKTTQELLEEIQSRGAAAPASPPSPAAPHSPDVVLIEPTPSLVKVESPLRNGAPSPPPTSPLIPLEDEREYFECTCGEEPSPLCPAAPTTLVRPHHITALHHAYLPGVNGTRAPLYPHKFAVRPAQDPENPALFASVVPLYNYSDYADDYCVKNMYKVPICTHIPPSTFAPAPPSPPRRPSPPPARPYPLDPDPPDPPATDMDVGEDKCLVEESPPIKLEPIKIEPSEVGAPPLEPSDRLKPPLLTDEEAPRPSSPPLPPPSPPKLFATEDPEHRTVEKTKERVELSGRQLVEQCQRAIDSIPYDYSQLRAAPEVTLPVGVDREDEAEALVSRVLEDGDTERDVVGRPPRAQRFAEWHECARLGALVALPYVVID